jgi:hypothetical protein
MTSVQWAIQLGAIALLLGTTLALQVPKLNQRLEGQTLASDLQVLRQEEVRLNFLNQLPASGFGFNNLIADFAFLQFLQYFGDDVARVEHKTGFALSPKYFEVIVNRDPRFIYSYLYLSTSVSMFAAQPERAIAMYDKGLQTLNPEQVPYAYTVWRRKAIDRLLFLGDANGARQDYLTAATWVERATFGSDALPEVKYVAQWSRESAAALKDNKNLRGAQIAAWQLVLSSAVDRKTARIALQKLDELGMRAIIKDGKLELVPKGKS